MTATEIKIGDLDHATTRGIHVGVEKHARSKIQGVLALENKISYRQIMVVQWKSRYDLCDEMHVDIDNEGSKKKRGMSLCNKVKMEKEKYEDTDIILKVSWRLRK